MKVIPAGTEDELVRRLATGVIAQWAKLPAEAQKAILSEAVLAWDATSKRTGLEQDLKAFISRNQGK